MIYPTALTLTYVEFVARHLMKISAEVTNNASLRFLCVNGPHGEGSLFELLLILYSSLTVFIFVFSYLWQKSFEVFLSYCFRRTFPGSCIVECISVCRVLKYCIVWELKFIRDID